MTKSSRKFLFFGGIFTILLAILWFLLPILAHFISSSPMFPKGVRTAAVNLEAMARATSNNQKIDFYGELVDQDGKPVPNADVSLNYSVYSAQEMASGNTLARHYFDAKTDGKGVFEVHLSGERLEVMEFKKDGYFFPSYPSLQSRNWYCDGPGVRMPATDAAHPYKFLIQKVSEKPERLWDLSIGRPEYTTSDFGQVISFYLEPNAIRALGNAVPGKKSDADLWITVWRGPLITTKIAGKYIWDWSYAIEVPHGGLIKIDTSYPFNPPDDGYQTEYSFAADSKNSNWTSDSSNQFYLKIRDGKMYGAIRIGVHVNNVAAIGISGFLNTSGSRNFQPGGGFLNR